MNRSVNEASGFLNLFDILATTATGIAAPVVGADDVFDGTGPIEDTNDPTFVMSVVQDDLVPPPPPEP